MFWWQVDESFRSELDEAGLGQFETLMDKPVGELLDSNEGSRQLRRIILDSGSRPRLLFLKRIGRERIGILLRMLVFGKKPLSGPLREKMLIDALSAAGLPVMRALAWGEERRLGLPVRGFLLVEGVRGSDIATLFKTSASQKRLLLMECFGMFVGRLHRKGFYHPIRLKDVFCEPQQRAHSPLLAAGLASESEIDQKSSRSKIPRPLCGGEPQSCADSYSFVLIDRESSKPWASRFSCRRCVNSLARAYRRTIRDGHQFTSEEIKKFNRAYLIGLSDNHLASKRLLRQKIYSGLKKELKDFLG